MSESSVGLACLRDPPSSAVATSSASSKRGAGPSHSATSTITTSRSADHRSGGSGNGDGGSSSTQQDMYVTLNSAAQHSPDTVWTLPGSGGSGEQQLPGDSTPLLSSREVEAVVDAMEESPMPQFETDEDAEVQASTARAKATDSKDHNNSRDLLSPGTVIQPWQMEVQGLPWQSRHPTLMKNLTELWKRNSMCPHPHCPNGASTKQSNPTANPLIYHHWYTLHMAPGYCKIFTCELCSSVLKTKPALKTHLMKVHSFTDSSASSLVRKIEIKWENLVDGKKDQTDGLPWKHGDSVSLKQLFAKWKANKYSCPHRACKSRIYRPWQAILHWYQDHMAPGYAQIYPCVLCGKPFTLVEFLRTHLSAEHDLMQDIIDGMVEKISADWAKMIELKTPLTDAVVAAHLKERASDKPIPPMKLVEAPGMPWKIWCLETSRAVIAAWLLDDRGRCPHPSCNDRFKTETDVMLHWQDIHMAPDFGITYPCQHGVGSQFPCPKVFINRHDIIIHSRNEHGYSDWVIEAMLRNIESASQKRLLIMDHTKALPQQSTDTDSGVASGAENQTLSPPTPPHQSQPQVTQPQPQRQQHQHQQQAAPAVPENNGHSSPLPYGCQHGLGSQFPCHEHFPTKQELMDHAKTVHGYNDFTLHAMIRNVEVNRCQSSKQPLTNGHHAALVPAASPAVAPVAAPCPVVAATSPVPATTTTAMALLQSSVGGGQDRQDLQSVLWKAIVAAWSNNKKCPHPKCSPAEDNLYNEYGQMLGHWMRHHIDYSLAERTFYPCLHGQESHDLCMRVFTSAIDLKLHSVHEHHYGSEEIDVFLATLEAHVDNLTREYTEIDGSPAVPVAQSVEPAEKVQTIREDYHDDGAPVYKRRRFSEDSMG